MDREVYLQLGKSDDPWHCATCLLPAFRDSYFKDTRVIDISALTDTGTEDEIWNLSNTRKRTITHLNIRSLLPKLDKVRSRLAGRSPPSIIAFTESWLDNTVSDGEICIPGYKVYRKDRNWNGGGIVLFVDEELRINRRTDLESTDLKAVWLEIRERANRQALIGAIYRPPSSDSRFMVDLADTLQLIRSEQKEVVILGDLNCNMLKRDGPTKQLRDIFAENQLHQLVASPTRITSRSETIIDLFVTNEPTGYAEVRCRDCSLSDHQLVYGIRKERMDSRKPDHTVYQYRAYSKCNPEALQRDLD